jgi:two-component system response regulator AtoC
MVGVDRGSSSSHDPSSPAALELLVVASDGVRVTPLPARGQVMLGRGDECEVRIENRSVSRRHAVIHIGEALRIEDLGSANGTFVRDLRSASDTTGAQPLRKLSRESIQITVGERVNLGSVPIVVRWAVGARRDPATSAPVVVRDPAMRALYEQVARAARSTISVLFLGEAGVGKEVLAREIHERSPRAAGPYVELDCAAVPPSQLEGELFGHEQNAFTGASQGRPGLLERADGGTIFLDEVAELPLPVQVKLLRVLEDGKVLRVGGRAPRQLDLRFVAASHRDLAAEAARGPFRQDLYFRLNGVSFVVPPLRERVSEIAPLAEQFLAAATRGLGRPPLRFSMEALRALESYAWPGNVRELHNVIERAAILADGDVILPADLPGRLTGAATGPVRRLDARTTTGPVRRVEARTGPVTAEIKPLVSGASAERQRIVEALEQCGGNQTRAAKLLRLSLRTLAHRIAEYNVPLPRKR